MGQVSIRDLMPHYPCKIDPGSISDQALLYPALADVHSKADCLDYISNSSKELRSDFLNYLLNDYADWTIAGERNEYLDVGNISAFIVLKVKLERTSYLEGIFSRCESLLSLDDRDITEFVVVGLFEGIQNICGWHGVDYHKGFDSWLGPESKRAWDELIDFWERKSE